MWNDFGVFEQRPDERDQEIHDLRLERDSLRDRVCELEGLVKDLRSQLNQHSGNSSVPPSQESPRHRHQRQKRRKSSSKKPRSSSNKPSKPPSRLRFSEEVSELKEISTSECPGCGHDLRKASVYGHRRQQQWELPPVSLVVKECRVEEKYCSCCQKVVHAPFEEAQASPIEYGPHFKSFLVYLHYYQLIPLRRIGELCQDLLGQPVDPGSILNAGACAEQSAQGSLQWIQQQLLNQTLLHADETSLSLNGKNHWLHSLSNEQWSFYQANAHRGFEGMITDSPLPEFQGQLMHDYWKAYLRLDVDHYFCGAHLIRELEAVIEKEEAPWAKELQEWMLETKEEVRRSREYGEVELPDWLANAYWKEYQNILSRAETFYQLKDPPLSKASRGRSKQWKGKNLLDRFLTFPRKMTGYLWDFQVPFSNNQAERDIRMVKLRSKISGAFRSKKGMDRFCVIRSLMDSCKKNHISILQATTELLTKSHPHVLSHFTAIAK